LQRAADKEKTNREKTHEAQCENKEFLLTSHHKEN
jgi:hypothetical protein